MATRQISRGRPPAKQNILLDHLRSRIISGDLKPGDQLPTWSDLERQFDVSRVTVQRAIDQLSRDGFVYARGRRGTLVAESLPHACRYGLVFSVPQDDLSDWRRFWIALLQEAMRIGRDEHRQVPVYFGINREKGTGDYEALVADIRSHRLAGVILTSSICLPPVSDVLEAAGVPSVVVRSRVQSVNVPAVTLSGTALIDKALDYFASIGRRRIAVLSHGGWMFENSGQAVINDALAERGMETRPYWLACADLSVPQTARSLIHGIFHADQRVRPDALLVQDDNLFEHAMDGLNDARLRSPDEVSVVTHANFPLVLNGAYPARRLGIDTHLVLKTCFDSIDAQRRGDTVPADQIVEPLFEEERGRHVRAGV